MDKPIKPCVAAFMLHKHGSVRKMEVDYRMTSEDTSDDMLKIVYADGTKATLNHSADFYSVARWVGHWPALFELKPEIAAQVDAFQKWERANAAELATYKRLKAKYESPTQPGEAL